MKLVVLVVLLAHFYIISETEGHFWGRRRRRRRRISPPPPEPDCYVSAWSSWSACSERCSFGTQERTRHLTGGPTTFCQRPNLRQQQNCGAVNGGCQEICHSATGACSCRPGYSLLSDGKRCQDINECQTQGGRGPCSHSCQNNPGSYTCHCPNGYVLGNDKKTCQAKDCGTPFFTHCYAPVYTDHLGMVCRKVTSSCPSGTRLNAQCQFACPANFAIAKLNDFGLPFAKHVPASAFQNVITSTTCGVGSSGNPVWSDASTFAADYFCRRTNDPPSNILLSKNTLKEHSPVGMIIGILSVQIPDPDDGITYSIQPSAGRYFFKTQGNKVLSTWVPRWNNLQGLNINDYHIIIRATDNGNPPMWLDKNFTITILNVNDPPNSIRISNNSVMDTATLNHVVGVLTAVDYDGPRGKLPSQDFVWKMVDDDRGRFALRGANVVVAAALDHQAHQYHRIIVNCTDKDPTNPRWVLTTIVINVINTNDSPKSVRFTTFKLYENASIGFVAGEFIASDEDSDPIAFSLSQSDIDTQRTFELGHTSCTNTTIKSVRHSVCKSSLILKKNIDYETKNSYSLKISATDPSGGVTIAEFMIHVINLNEPPTDIMISKDTIRENSPVNTVVGQLTITDPDTSQRSPQGHICTVSPMNPFSINGLNLIVNGALDYESKSAYQVNITCTDTGIPPLSLWKRFVIKVQDQNERPEYLTLTRTSIQENAPVGSTVGELLSRDPDVNTVKLTFHVKSPVNSPFTVAGRNNRSLVTTKLLDYETMQEINLLISVTDDSGLSLEKNFKIKIIDVNEAPTDIVLSPQTIPENSPPGTWVGSITVLDTDFNSSASCRIVDGNTNYFAVSVMHLVAGTKKIDYEALGSTKSLPVKLRCADAYGLHVEKVFFITVTDVNEPPTSIQISLHSVPENQINALVGQMTVRDPDIGQAHVCKAVVNDTESLLFTVDAKTLKLKTRRPLNFEHAKQHPITIRCSDKTNANQSQFTIFKDIKVHVVDINENPYKPCPNEIFVDEAASNGSVIWTFKPRDPDNEEYETGMRHNVTSLQPKQHLILNVATSAANLPFQIANEQYLVKNGKLNRVKQSVYSLPVNVTDDGMLLRLAKGTYELYQGHKVSYTYNCKVRVLASGDQRLALDITLSSNVIAEDALNGTKIGTLSIINGKPGKAYQLRVMQAAVAPFRIVGNDLILVIGVPLDYETTNSTGVGIIAVGSDGTTVQRLFLIRITNVNERPTSMCIFGSKTVEELKNLDQIIGQIFIEDPDHVESLRICSKVKPTLKQAQNYTCEIDSNVIDVSGLIKLFYIDRALRLHGNGTFDYHANKQYLVPIICRDIHKPIHLVELTTTINVKENTLIPRWDFILSSNTVAEDAINGTEVGTFTVVSGGSDSYSFRVTDINKPFKAVGMKLMLFTSAPLDYETSNSTSIVVESTNSAGLIVSKSFQIRITNVNERPVNMCLINTLTVIPEKSPVNTAIGHLIIEDPDYPRSKDLCKNAAKVVSQDHTYTCEIFSNTINVNDIKMKFYVDQHFYLHRKSDFDYKTRSLYSIPIMCRDKTKPIHLIEKTFDVRIQAPSCQANFELVNGVCVCANRMSGPKCDRDPYICAKTNCDKTEVCVSHIYALKRCIPRSNQIPVLLQLPFTIVSKLENRYKIEGYLESIFEGTRPPGKTLNSLFSKNVISRRRREVAKDIYVEAAKSQKVLSFYSYVIFVAMDPTSSYKALSGSSMCALLNGADIRCVNKEDCKLLQQAGIECPYVFPDIGKSGTGKRTGENGSSAGQPWAYGVGAAVLICIFAALLIFFVIKRRRSKRKSDQPVMFQELNDSTVNGLENPIYSRETTSPDASPQVAAGKRGLQPLVKNNLMDHRSTKRPANIKIFENALYDKSLNDNPGTFDVNNPAYGTMSFLPPPRPDDHLYESVGKKLGKEAVNLMLEEEKKMAKEKGFDQDRVELPKGKNGKLQGDERASLPKQDNRKVLNIKRHPNGDADC